MRHGGYLPHVLATALFCSAAVGQRPTGPSGPTASRAPTTAESVCSFWNCSCQDLSDWWGTRPSDYVQGGFISACAPNVAYNWWRDVGMCNTTSSGSEVFEGCVGYGAADCTAWGCSCQGHSDYTGTPTGHCPFIGRDPVALWYYNLIGCTTTPSSGPPHAYCAPTVSPSDPTNSPVSCCAILDTHGRLVVKYRVPRRARNLPWLPGSTAERRAAAQTHGAEVELILPPGSTSPGGYLYDADLYFFGDPEPEHCLGSGLNVTLTCVGTPHCAVYVFVYHQPPFSANTNGGFPQLADSAGWQARSRCAPRFGNDTGSCPMLGLRYNLMENQPVQIEQAAGTDLQYFLIAVVARKNCADNTLDDQAKCTEVPATNLSTTCVWNSGTNACEDDWCPPQLAAASSSAGGAGGGSGPTQCPVDLDCSGNGDR